MKLDRCSMDKILADIKTLCVLYDTDVILNQEQRPCSWNSFSDEELLIVFGRKFHHWHTTSLTQKLSEEFVEYFQNQINWVWLSQNRCLTESMVRKFSHLLDIDSIINHSESLTNLSPEFIKTLKVWS